MEMMFQAERTDLAHTVQVMFDRKDTNVAGGNMSIKVFDENEHPYILITPTFMSETYYAELHPAQILVVDAITGQKIDGVGDVTREINMHEKAYATHPGIRCVYHSHAEESMFWATAGLDMPNVTEATRELGRIRVLPLHQQLQWHWLISYMMLCLKLVTRLWRMSFYLIVMVL